jgi:NADH:ubiquinone oxidoreductase subunit D
MTTVMTWSNSGGEQGRCDAKCHTAHNAECDCMCGGRFHGAALRPGGVERAVDEYGEEVLRSAKARAAREGMKLETVLQRDLFASLGPRSAGASGQQREAEVDVGGWER